ncbi:MAG: hemerythrin domain-containing protein [Myxococcaceae bacterium]|nr:hemerythrin domain-containing protein [Myxococcaceae bacterium]
MTPPPTLLDDDRTASLATPLMMSHHGFRRDLQRFAVALEAVAHGEHSRVAALREEWSRFGATLHGHHHSEDTGVFPSLLQQRPAVAWVLAHLQADHRQLDPLVERGAAAFARLPDAGEALALVRELQALLEPHLATEERELIPHLRAGKSFPPLPDDALELYAQGFAWAMHGIAPDVVAQVEAMLPEGLRARLPEARAAYRARCVEVWGTDAAGAARTPIPAPFTR